MSRRSTDWRSIVVQADPDHARKSRIVTEYEFTAPNGPMMIGEGDEQSYQDGRRIFIGDYQKRGPYRDS